MGSMDKAWRTGTGQDKDWWLGFWDDSRPPNDQPAMGRLFNINSKWPLPLKPSEYVRARSTSSSPTTRWPWPPATSPG
jgi:hypothetical protein